MASISDVIDRWLDTIHGRKSGAGRPLENLNGSNVHGRGDILYSYGSHFPLCEHYRRLPWRDPRSGRVHRRARALFLLNADTFSVSTSRHQRETISAVNSRAGEYFAEVLLMPFSALDAAGILRPTIVPLDIRPDEWETVASRPCPVESFEPETAHSVSERTSYDGRTIKVHVWRADGYRFERDEYPDADGPGPVYVREWPPGEPHTFADDAPGSWTRPDTGDTSELVTRRHRMGDSVFTAAVAGRRTVRRECTVSDVVRHGLACVRSARYSPGSEPASVRMDWLDVSAPIVETVDVWRRRRFVSSFDMNEPAASYFLATLPAVSRAVTVGMAIEDLAPAAVHAAIARGRDVRRQGDIFAIETDLETVPDEWPRARLTMWTRGARALVNEPGYVAPLRAADRRRIVDIARRDWRRRWRSVSPSGPHTSPGARGRFATIARDRATKLERARLAGRAAILQARVDVRREWIPWQESETRSGYYHERPYIAGAERARDMAASAAGYGDSFGHMSRAHSRDVYRRHEPPAAALWRQCLTAAYEKVRPAARPAVQSRARERARALLSVHGTAHTATEVARGPGGTIYVRGILRHEPALVNENRARDHVNVRLGDGTRWYLAVRNTVPRARADTNGRR